MILKVGHIDQVVKMSNRFIDYLKSTKDADASKLAKIQGLRDDEFGNEAGTARKSS